MNPWVIGGVIVGIGAAAYVFGSAQEECEVVEEYAAPYWLSVIWIRKCDDDGKTVWLWDVALLEDVQLGEWSVETWPERSLGFGQRSTHDDALADAIAWVDANESFVEGGAQRSPLAQRAEDFLAGLTPGELERLRAVFDQIDLRIGALVEQLRVAQTDEAFVEVGRQMGGLLNSVDQSTLQQEILDAVGWVNGLVLKGILDDAGVT